MLNIRAHHLLCIPRYHNKGYNKVFAENHMKICMNIRKNPSQRIKIVRRLDDICSKCPYKKGTTCAKTPDGQKYAIQLDNKVLKKLNIKENSVHQAKEIFNLSMNKIPSVKKICDKNDVYYKGCTHENHGTGINDSFRNDLNK